MREMLASSLRGDVRVEMAFAADLWPVDIDAGELELAIVNLCVNARDAMPAGGTITIAAENLRAVDGSPGEFVRLSVTDTGTGIPPEILARVFDPFFTTKDVGKGSGLGLAQVYGFAQQSGGRVFVESDVGVGTVVTLLLPKSVRPTVSGKPDPEPPLPSPVRTATTRRGQALLVEDDTEVAALAREMLAVLGFSVIHVSSAAAALGALANERSVEVVFTDIMMPGGTSGVDLAREARRRNPNLVIVLTTGYAESAAGLRDGEFRLLLKPYSLEALSSALGVDIGSP
jgi:CheY-like chemotaxis protein